MKKTLFGIALGIGLMITGSVLAAPPTNFLVNSAPALNDAYDTGTTTPANEWLHVYTQQLCLSGDCKSAWPTGNGGYPFPLTGNATSTLTQFNGGLTAYASSTIGNGTQPGGLTISGGATTTGNAFFGMGTSLWSYGPNASLSNAFTFTSAGMTESMFTLGSTGNVGVGDTSPTVRLSVVDNSGYAGVAAHNIFTVASTTGLGTGTTTLFSINSGNYSNFSGNVNIGTTSNQGSPLYVQSTGGTAVFQTNTGGTALALTTPTNAVGDTIYLFINNRERLGYVNGVVVLDDNATSKPIQINSGGKIGIDISTTNNNVGVGTSSPFAKLSVHANAIETGLTLFAVSSSTPTATSTLFSISNTGAITTSLGTGCVTATSGLLSASGSCGGSFSYPFPVIGLGTTSPIMLLASTTIGNGAQFGGLTISGGATTTLAANFLSTVNIGTTSNQGTPLFVQSAGAAAVFQSVTGNTGLALTTVSNAVGDTLNFVINNRLRLGYVNGTVILDSNATSKPIQINSIGIGLVVNTTNNVGVGTTSPFAKFSINGNAIDTNSLLFSVASSTATATTTLFAIDNVGHFNYQAASSTCGTGCTNIVGDDDGGTVTTGTAVSSVTVNFGAVWKVTPVCTVTDSSTSVSADISSISTSAFTVGLSIGLTGTIYYQCGAYR